MFKPSEININKAGKMREERKAKFVPTKGKKASKTKWCYTFIQHNINHINKTYLYPYEFLLQSEYPSFNLFKIFKNYKQTKDLTDVIQQLSINQASSLPLRINLRSSVVQSSNKGNFFKIHLQTTNRAQWLISTKWPVSLSKEQHPVGIGDDLNQEDKEQRSYRRDQICQSWDRFELNQLHQSFTVWIQKPNPRSMHGFAKGPHHQEPILMEASWANQQKWRYRSPSLDFGTEVET